MSRGGFVRRYLRKILKSAGNSRVFTTSRDSSPARRAVATPYSHFVQAL